MPTKIGSPRINPKTKQTLNELAQTPQRKGASPYLVGQNLVKIVDGKAVPVKR